MRQQVRLAPRLLALPKPDLMKCMQDWNFDYSIHQEDEPVRKTEEVMYLGGQSPHAVTIALCTRDMSGLPGGAGRAPNQELYLARWRKLHGSWGQANKLFLRLDQYAVPLHDALCHFLRREGLDPCQPELPSTPYGHWIRVSEDGTGNV